MALHVCMTNLTYMYNNDGKKKDIIIGCNKLKA